MLTILGSDRFYTINYKGVILTLLFFKHGSNFIKKNVIAMLKQAETNQLMITTYRSKTENKSEDLM